MILGKDPRHGKLHATPMMLFWLLLIFYSKLNLRAVRRSMLDLYSATVLHAARASPALADVVQLRWILMSLPATQANQKTCCCITLLALCRKGLTSCSAGNLCTMGRSSAVMETIAFPNLCTPWWTGRRFASLRLLWLGVGWMGACSRLCPLRQGSRGRASKLI